MIPEKFISANKKIKEYVKETYETTSNIYKAVVYKNAAITMILSDRDNDIEKWSVDEIVEYIIGCIKNFKEV